MLGWDSQRQLPGTQLVLWENLDKEKCLEMVTGRERDTEEGTRQTGKQIDSTNVGERQQREAEAEIKAAEAMR